MSNYNASARGEPSQMWQFFKKFSELRIPCPSSIANLIISSTFGVTPNDMLGRTVITRLKAYDKMSLQRYRVSATEPFPRASTVA